MLRLRWTNVFSSIWRSFITIVPKNTSKYSAKAYSYSSVCRCISRLFFAVSVFTGRLARSRLKCKRCRPTSRLLLSVGRTHSIFDYIFKCWRHLWNFAQRMCSLLSGRLYSLAQTVWYIVYLSNVLLFCECVHSMICSLLNSHDFPPALFDTRN